MRHKVLTAIFTLALLLSGLGVSVALPICDPRPKPLAVDLLPDDRESVLPHQGDVVVEFTVEVTGTVTDPTIVSSTDSWFDRNVLDSAPQWRFTRPREACRLQMPVHFQLRHDK
jgi:TonB family protein